jgi:4-alpha-glucanotransferase
MKVLQFAFCTDVTNEYLPINYKTDNCVVYTGTHDNDTTNGWYAELSAKEKRFFDRYTERAKTETPADAIIRTALDSKARLAIIPMQDVLNLGGECRMNYPSKLGYWKYRLKKEELL